MSTRREDLYEIYTNMVGDESTFIHFYIYNRVQKIVKDYDLQGEFVQGQSFQDSFIPDANEDLSFLTSKELKKDAERWALDELGYHLVECETKSWKIHK